MPKLDGLKLITAPTEEPVTLVEAKAWIRVDGATEDALIGALITAARQYVERQAQIAILPQTWRAQFDCWPDAAPDGRGGFLPPVLQLPRPPLVSVTTLKYFPADGSDQVTMDAAEYQVDDVSYPGRVAPAPDESWPALASGRLGAVQIDYVAGYANPAAVPMCIRQAILLIVAHWYEHRESVLTGTISKEVEQSAANLIAQEWPGVMWGD